MFKEHTLNYINKGRTENSKALRFITIFLSSLFLFSLIGYIAYRTILFIENKINTVISYSTHLFNSGFIDLFNSYFIPLFSFIASDILMNYLLISIFFSTIIAWKLYKGFLKEKPKTITVVNTESLFWISFTYLFYSMWQFIEIAIAGKHIVSFYGFLSFSVAGVVLYIMSYVILFLETGRTGDIINIIKGKVWRSISLKFLSLTYFIVLFLSFYVDYFWFLSLSVLLLILLNTLCFIMETNVIKDDRVNILKGRGVDFNKNAIDGNSLENYTLYCLLRIELAVFCESILKSRYKGDEQGYDSIKLKTFIEEASTVIEDADIPHDEVLSFYVSDDANLEEIYIFDLDNNYIGSINTNINS